MRGFLVLIMISKYDVAMVRSGAVLRAVVN
jgi:hypothetical protein